MPASAHTDSPPSRILRITASGSFSSGMPRIASAKMGRAPMAYTSEMALVAAMRPKSNGSSTIGVKKSVVATSAWLSLRRYTAASSAVSVPTSRSLGRPRIGAAERISDSTAGAILQPQPPPWLNSVRRIRSGAFIGVKFYSGFQALRHRYRLPLAGRVRRRPHPGRDLGARARRWRARDGRHAVQAALGVRGEEARRFAGGEERGAAPGNALRRQAARLAPARVLLARRQALRRHGPYPARSRLGRADAGRRLSPLPALGGDAAREPAREARPARDPRPHRQRQEPPARRVAQRRRAGARPRGARRAPRLGARQPARSAAADAEVVRKPAARGARFPGRRPAGVRGGRIEEDRAA